MIPGTMNWKIFNILFLAIFCSTLGQGIVVPLLPQYAHELGATSLLIGMIFGAFSLSRTAFLFYFARFSDRKGKKPVIAAGLFIYFIASIGFTLSRDVTSLIAVRFFQGVAAAMILPVAQAYAGEITPMNREGFVMGLFNVSLYGGLSAGPILGGIMMDLYGIQSAFISMGVVCLAGLGLCLGFLPPVSKEDTHKKNAEPVSFRILIRNRHVLNLFLFRFAHTICIGSVYSFAPLIAGKTLKLSSSSIGIMITLCVLITAIIMTPMGMLADRMSKRALLVISGIIGAISMYTIAIVTAPWQMYLATVLLGFGGGLAIPAIMSMTVVLGRMESSMSSMMSMLAMSHSLGMIIGPLLIGRLIDVVDFRTAFIVAALIMVASTVICLFLSSGFSELERSADTA